MNGEDDEQWDQINLLELIDVLIKQIKAHNDNQYETGIASTHEKDLIQNTKNEGLQKAVASKIASRQNKRDIYDQSKAALSRRNVEIEKKLVEQETQIRRLKQDLQNANIDKAKYKRFHDEEKRKKNAGEEAIPLTQ